MHIYRSWVVRYEFLARIVRAYYVCHDEMEKCSTLCEGSSCEDVARIDRELNVQTGTNFTCRYTANHTRFVKWCLDYFCFGRTILAEVHKFLWCALLFTFSVAPAFFIKDFAECRAKSRHNRVKEGRIGEFLVTNMPFGSK